MCILLHFIYLLSRRINQLFRSTGQTFSPVDTDYPGMHCILFDTYFPVKERKDMQDGGLNSYRI